MDKGDLLLMLYLDLQKGFGCVSCQSFIEQVSCQGTDSFINCKMAKAP